MVCSVQLLCSYAPLHWGCICCWTRKASLMKPQIKRNYETRSLKSFLNSTFNFSRHAIFQSWNSNWIGPVNPSSSWGVAVKCEAPEIAGPDHVPGICWSIVAPVSTMLAARDGQTSRDRSGPTGAVVARPCTHDALYSSQQRHCSGSSLFRIIPKVRWGPAPGLRLQRWTQRGKALWFLVS